MTISTHFRRTTHSMLAGLLAVLGFSAGAEALGPTPNPAHWTVAGMPKKPLTPGATFPLTLTAQIEPGWHIYAMEEPEGGPIATQIGLAEGDPLTMLSVDEPKPQMVRDATLHQPTGMFQNTANFTLHMQAPPKRLEPGVSSSILVRYQSCNDQVCLPPRTETIPLR